MLSTAASLLLILLSLASASFAENSMVEVTPSEQIVLPGTKVQMLCKAPFEIISCRIEFPHNETYYDLSPGEYSSPENPTYYGTGGFKAGECGMRLIEAKEKHNGNFKCILRPKRSDNVVSGIMKLTVAQYPEWPIIEVNFDLKANEDLQASCTVANGRPAANITWSLDDEKVIEGTHYEIFDVPGTDLKTAVLNLTKRLDPTDNNKKLKCFAEHISYGDSGAYKQQWLQVSFPPQPIENTTEIFGLEIGESAEINVTIWANPRPFLFWYIREAELLGGYVDEEVYRMGMEAFAAKDVGTDLWNATLRINTIMEEDVEKDFFLTAHNNYGRQEYVIRIRASSEPKGIHFGVVVGIVVGIVVLLLIILIVCILKTTKILHNGI